MQFKKILTAAATAVVLTVAGAGAASADPYGYHDGRGDIRADRHDVRADRRDLRDDRRDLRLDRRMVDRRVVFNTLRNRHIRYSGDPYFVRGHYVVKSFDRFGHVVFVEVNPYTGGVVGIIRL